MPLAVKGPGLIFEHPACSVFLFPVPVCQFLFLSLSALSDNHTTTLIGTTMPLPKSFLLISPSLTRSYEGECQFNTIYSKNILVGQGAHCFRRTGENNKTSNRAKVTLGARALG